MREDAFDVVVSVNAVGRHFGYVHSGPDLELTEDDGTTRYFGVGMVSVDLPSESANSSANGASFSLVDDIMWRDALQGRTIHDAVVRILAVPPGATRFRDCAVLYEGIVDSFSYEPDSGVLGVQTGTMELREEQAFPPGLVGDYLRFPNNTASDVHQDGSTAVPIIYGVNYDVPLVALDDPQAVMPAPPAGPPGWRYLIAGHRIADTVYAAGEIVDNDGAAFGGPYTVHTDIDGLGGFFSYIAYAGAGPPPDQLYALQVRGKEKNGQLISGLSDVLEDIWLNYGPNSTPLDYKRVTNAQGPLNAFSVAVRFDQQERGATLSDLLQSRFGAQFPVSLTLWGGRFGWDYIGRKADRPPVGKIKYGQNTFSRTAIGTTARSEVVNKVDVAYQRSGRSAGTQQGYRLDRTNDLRCRASVSRWGASRSAVLDVPDASQTFSGDNNAAYLAASELLERTYDVFTTVSYLVVDFNPLRWNLGDVVLVTDSDMGWEDARFYLRGKQPNVSGQVEITLESELPFYARK